MRNLWKNLTQSSGAGTDSGDSSLGRDLRALGEVGAFPDLSETALVRLFNRADSRRLAPGDLLFKANSRADALYIVTSGRIALGTDACPDQEHFEPGDWICDVDLDSPGVHAATATAVTQSAALIIDARTHATLDGDLKDYLAHRARQLNLQRLWRLQRLSGALAERGECLTEALFQASTHSSGRFTETETARQLFAKVPALPVSTTLLLNKMLDERTTKNEIVDLVSMDPALTSTLLKAVNSPFYGFQHQVTSISHAIVLLGHNTVYQIIMTESMRRSLPENELFTDVHQRAIELSRLAFTLAQTVNAGKSAEVATIGILGDIGLVITELLKASNPRLKPLFDLLSSAEMGAALLRSWHLPKVLCDSLHYQRYPEFTPPERVPEEVRANVALLYLSRRFLDRLHGREPRSSTLFLDAYMAALKQSHLSETELLYSRLVPRLRANLRQLPRSLADCLTTDPDA
ncbi:MAG: HDOD domain-containing protein [Chromatiaceae bacterium]|nr:HDOD domain-containing protein [Chromatiaceae bacterium]